MNHAQTNASLHLVRLPKFEFQRVADRANTFPNKYLAYQNFVWLQMLRAQRPLLILPHGQQHASHDHHHRPLT